MKTIKTKLSPSRSAIIFGYVGSNVGANDIFKFKKCTHFGNDKEGFIGLVTNYSLIKTRHDRQWKRVRIIVDVVDDGSDDALW